MNVYRAVEGILPRKRDVALWSHDRFMDFFRFVTHFMNGEMVKPTRANRKEIEKIMAEVPNHPWAEFMWRINCFTTNVQATDRKFYYRIASMIRLIGAFIKQNPALVTDEMKELIKDNPRLNWVLGHYKVIKTQIGAEVVVKDTLDTTGFVKASVPVATPETSLMEVMLKTANVFDMIVSSIKTSEIKDMDVKDKISALSKLSFIWTQTRNMKPNTTVFNKINVYKESKEVLEKSLLDFHQNENDGNNGGLPK